MVYSRRVVEAKQNLYASAKILTRAKALRKKMTPSEKTLWKYLRRGQQKGFHFRKQHPYNIYILDFYCFEANLAIEVDGKIHLNQIEYDLEKTRFLESSGLKVLRILNEDIEMRLEWVLEIINTSLQRNPATKVRTNHFPLGGNRKGGSG
jgi:very-short-patch-repair endonuclease